MPDARDPVVHESDLHGRMLVVERQIERVTTQVERLITGTDKLEKAVSSLTTVMADNNSRTQERINEVRRPNWAVWFSGFGAVIVVAGWYMSSKVDPLDQRISLTMSEITALKRADERIIDLIDKISRERAADAVERARIEERLRRAETPKAP